MQLGPRGVGSQPGTPCAGSSRRVIASASGYRTEWPGMRGITAALLAALLLAACGSTDEPAEESAPASSPLLTQVEAAFRDSYGDPADWLIERFSDDNGASNVTVVSRLAHKPENSEDAMGTCMTVASLGISDGITADWNRVIVTAGERGAFIAECDPVRATQ